MIRIFGHYIPRGLLMLAVAEAAILLAAMYVGAMLRTGAAGQGEAAATVSFLFPQGALFLLVMLSMMTALGLYQRDPKEGEWTHFPRVWASFGLGLVLMSLLISVSPSLFLQRGAFEVSFVVALLGVTATRYYYMKLAAVRQARRRVLVLGTGANARKIDALEKLNGRRGAFEVVGYVPMQAESERDADVRLKGLPDSTAPVSALVKRHRIDEIVVALRDRRGSLPTQQLLESRLHGVQVTDLPAFFERETGRILLEAVNPGWLIFADGFRLRKFTKRVFDIAASIALLIVAGPIMIVAALLIRLEDRGPVFYRQERVGQGGRVFRLLKFRSMRCDAEGDGVPRWAQKNDDRVTRVGRFIRKVRIDELPQVFNVLAGDMSFVGPRPERPYFVDQLSRDIPYYWCRHAVKPGITGWAQILYPYGASLEDAREKLQFDLYYVKNHSLFLDIVILLQTVQVLLFNDGAR